MLVLTRKCTEMIQIGDDIVIKVIKTGRSAVKIGIEAPSHVRVLRAELSDDSATSSQQTEKTDAETDSPTQDTVEVPAEAEADPEHRTRRQSELACSVC